MGRKAGQRIRSACEALEVIGPMSAADLGKVTGIKREHITNYCNRAIGLGLMTKELAKSKFGIYYIFTVVDGWEGIASRHSATKSKEPVAPRIKVSTRWSGVSSVFSMGAI